jgi:hypothetical protein
VPTERRPAVGIITSPYAGHADVRGRVAISEFDLDDVRAFKNGVLVRTYSRKR